MAKIRSKTQGSISKDSLAGLQGLVLKCLEQELTDGLENGQINQATIRNALQLLRDNDIVAVEDHADMFDRISTLLPKLDPLVISAARRYE